MSRHRLAPAFAAAASLLAFVAGCDGGRQQVEVLPAPVTAKPAIRVVASDENILAFHKLADGYSFRRDATFEIVPAQSTDIPEIIRRGSADLGITARKPDIGGKGSDLNYVPFAWDGAIFVAGAGAGVSSLSREQVAEIYAGRIGNWKQVGGRDLPIRVIDRPPYSAMRLAAAAILRRPLPSFPSAVVIETSDGAFQAVRMFEGGIACVPMSRTLIEKFPAVPLSIDGAPPRPAEDGKGDYPARLEYGMLFRKDAPEAVKEFANHLVSVDGIHQITSMALVPAAGNLPISSCHCRGTEGQASPSGKSPLSGTLTIGIIPELGTIQQEKRYAGIAQAIAEQLDVETRIRHLISYDEVVQAFLDGRIDAAFVGSLAYARLRTQAGVIPIARPENRGVSHYRGVIVARADGPVRRFADLRGKRFAYVPGTSAGELFMRDRVVRAGGGNPASYFSQPVPVRSHADALRLVLDGKADGAAVKDLVLRRIIAAEPGASGRIREIEHSGTFPENALVVAASAGERQIAKLRKVLLSLPDSPEGREALRALGADRFVPTTDADYANVYSLANGTGYPLDKK